MDFTYANEEEEDAALKKYYGSVESSTLALYEMISAALPEYFQGMFSFSGFQTNAGQK